MLKANDDRSPGVLSPDEPVMKGMKNMTDGPGTGRVIRRLSALLLAGVVFAGACEGDNLFSGDVVEYEPVVTSMSLPQVAFAGEQVTVRVDAAAARGISQLVLALRGAVSMDTVIQITPARARVSEVVKIAIPETLTDTLVLVQAAIIDQYGDASGTREGTVVVFGPPTITNVSAPTIVRLGELVSVRVTAFGARNVAQIDLVARGAIQVDTSIIVSPARSNVTQDIVLSMPLTAQDTTLTLSVGARDAAGQGSSAVSRTIPIVIDPPSIDLTTPATATAGMDLLTSIHAKGVRQITQVRLELRGAYVADVVVPISPTQSDVVQNVSVPLPGNIILSELRVRAAAVDRGGVVAYSSENMVTIPLGAPLVTSLEVPSAAFPGKTVDVRVRARGDRPITKVEVKFRGAIDDTQILSIDPRRTEVVQDAYVSIPLGATDSVLTIITTAIDISGAVSEIVSQSIPVTFTPAPAPQPEPAPLSLLTFGSFPSSQPVADRGIFGSTDRAFTTRGEAWRARFRSSP